MNVRDVLRLRSSKMATISELKEKNKLLQKQVQNLKAQLALAQVNAKKLDREIQKIIKERLDLSQRLREAMNDIVD